VAAVALIAMASPAGAAISLTSWTNWSGVAGRPLASGQAPVTHAEMVFDIPSLTCRPEDSHVSIWAGMDSPFPADRVTQAGVHGTCLRGVQHWYGWFEAAPAVYEQPMPELSDLHPGQHVFIQVDYRPDIASDAFVAAILVSTPGRVQWATKTFYSPSGAKQRARSECIVERPTVNGGLPPVARFQDFAVQCIGSGPVGSRFLPGNGTGQASVLGNLVTNRGKILVSVESLKSGTLMAFHWRAAK
jgi:hypothetical protein